MSNNSTTEFNVHSVYILFVNALRQPNNLESPIGTQDYIDGYRELLKFCDQLGYLFTFVTKDVVDKLGILQSFVDRDRNGPAHFDTIQKAIDYETEHNLIKSNPTNFARTLLRLHRALLFIIQLLQGLNESPLSESTTAIAGRCYDATLKNHHPFYICHSVKVGFLVLPSRTQLDDIIFHGRKDQLIGQYNTFITTMRQIYDTVEAYYRQKQYLQLP